MHKLLMLHNINQKELILQDVFETVLDHGTFKMIEELYEYLNLCKIKGNAALDNIFFNAIRKHNELLDIMHNKDRETSEKIFENASDAGYMSNDPLDTSGTQSQYLTVGPSKSRSQVSSPERKKLCASPVVNKDLEYAEKKARVKRYIDSINVKSDYSIKSKMMFRNRTFKKK